MTTRPLSTADKRHAILLALEAFPEKSQNQIAEQIGCSQRYVSTVREQMQVRTGSHLPDYVTGKDGKSYPATRSPRRFLASHRASHTRCHTRCHTGGLA